MDKALQIRIIKELLDQIDNGKNTDAGRMVRIPASEYVSESLAAQERKELFMNRPQLIGLSGDLPENNSFMTCDDLGLPILATRDAEGNFAAFINACKHRGSKLTNERRGIKKNFSCPFHAWNYSNQGDLRAIPQPDNFGEIDKSCFSLTTLPCRELNGLLWVHPNPDGVLDLEAFLGQLGEEIGTHDVGKLVYCDERPITKDLNWKLANDTFGETYHFSKLHKNTLAQVFHGDALAYEEFGEHHRFVFPRRVIDEMRQLPEEDWQLTVGAVVIYYLFPNVQLILNQTSATLVRIYPDEEKPGRSTSVVSHYFKQEALDLLKEYDPNRSDLKRVGAENVYDGSKLGEAVFGVDAAIEVFNSTVENEDYAMGELSQNAAETGAVEHFVFGRNETPLHHYHTQFRKALGREELEVV